MWDFSMLKNLYLDLSNKTAFIDGLSATQEKWVSLLYNHKIPLFVRFFSLYLPFSFFLPFPLPSLLFPNIAQLSSDLSFLPPQLEPTAEDPRGSQPQARCPRPKRWAAEKWRTLETNWDLDYRRIYAQLNKQICAGGLPCLVLICWQKSITWAQTTAP